MTAIRTTAILLALALAQVTYGAAISVVDLGNVDTTSIGGGVHTDLQVYQFVITRTTETAKLNAIELEVVATGNEVHEIWGETSSFGNNLYTASPQYGDISDPPQSLADSHFDPIGTNIWVLTVIAKQEDMATVVPGNNATNSYSGPVSSVDSEVSAFNFQAGFGTSFHYVGAVPGGSELEQYTVYQLVIPTNLEGNVTVSIDTTAPASGIYVKEFQFGTPIAPPEPGTLTLLGLGGLLLARRRRRAA